MPDCPRPVLLAGECHVWWASTTSARLSLLSYLDASERTRWASFHRCADRARYLTAHALARLVLAAHLHLPPASILFAADPCRRCGEPHGKPRVIGDAGMEVSITHSGTMAGIAAALCVPIGIDVEDLRRPDHGSLAGAALSDTEHATLAGFTDRERHRALLGYCTRKEALLKATGDGLTLPMHALTVAGPTQPPRLISWESRPDLASQMRLYDLHPAAGHVASLAAVGVDLAVREFWGDRLLQAAATTAEHPRTLL
jgi:4'-phosphopantetheinyl transferase